MQFVRFPFELRQAPVEGRIQVLASGAKNLLDGIHGETGLAV